MKIRVLDLFSGIGGFHLGLERAGFEVESYFSEIDKYAIQVYQNNFKDAKYVGSVTNVNGRELPRIDAITFGSPCQDFSLAGKRKGLDGNRSSLISEAIRLIEECRPSFFIWENVKGTFSSNNREDFAAILQAFANIGGYRLEWQLLNTKWFLPQNRERIYLVGYLGDGGGKQVFPIREVVESFVESGTGNRFIDVYNKTYRNECPSLLDPCHNNIRLQVNSATSCNQIVIGAMRGRNPENTSDRSTGSATQQTLEINKGGTSNTLTSVQKDNLVVSGTWRTHKDGQGFREIKGGDAPTIPARAREDGSGQPVVKYNYSQTHDSVLIGDYRSDEGYRERKDGCSPTLTAGNRANSSGSVPVPFVNKIRRLTPIECERLQGFPDNWTQFGTEGKISDTQRYKMCGNAVTVDVVEAVAKNIINVVFNG